MLLFGGYVTNRGRCRREVASDMFGTIHNNLDKIALWVTQKGSVENRKGNSYITPPGGIHPLSWGVQLQRDPINIEG